MFMFTSDKSNIVNRINEYFDKNPIVLNSIKECDVQRSDGSSLEIFFKTEDDYGRVLTYNVLGVSCRFDDRTTRNIFNIDNDQVWFGRGVLHKTRFFKDHIEPFIVMEDLG